MTTTSVSAEPKAPKKPFKSTLLTARNGRLGRFGRRGGGRVPARVGCRRRCGIVAAELVEHALAAAILAAAALIAGGRGHAVEYVDRMFAVARNQRQAERGREEND